MKEELNPETAKIQTEAAKDMLNTTMKTMRGMVKFLVISAIILVLLGVGSCIYMQKSREAHADKAMNRAVDAANSLMWGL